jgi:hypothetical protein
LEIIGKAQDADTFHLLGEVINYRYAIVNTGNQPLMGIVTVDDDKAVENCPEIKSLAPNEMVTCTGTYSITQADLDYGSVTNNAVARIGRTESNEATLTVRGVQAPNLTLSKAASPTTYDHVEQAITYTYTILNDGNVTLSPVQFTVNDDHISGGKQFNCSTETTELAPNVAVTCTATYNITQANMDARSVTNIAFAVVHGLERHLITTKPVTTTINYALPVTLSKTADLTSYDHVDQIITYTYTIQNINSVPLPGPVTLSDDRATATCPEIKSLGSTETVTCMGTYVITQADLDYGSVTNKAVAHIDGTESNVATVTVPADPHPGLGITKSANPTTYENVGQAITYIYVITNTGNVTLDPTTLSVSDNLINGGAPFPCGSENTGFAPTETITCPITAYNITQTDADSSSVTNSATALIVFGGKVISSPPVTFTVTYACPYPPAGWDPYIIQPGDTLFEISSWYGNAVLDLQRANCMGLSSDIKADAKLYVPYIASITGTVFADPNGSGKWEEAEEPVLAGFTVTISRIGGNFKGEVRTNGNGVYIIPNLPPGNYLVLYARVNLTSGKTVEQNFGLRPVP